MDCDLSPRQIVERLDQFIVGQDQAKRAVAIAVRNRWRRRQLSSEMRQEACKAYGSTVCQSRSHKIHRSRLLWPRRGKYCA